MKIKIDDIKEKPFQSRKKFDEKGIGVLAEDIKANGLIHPKKKRGDIFAEWLDIQCGKIYKESCEEIPEPKSWAKEDPTPAKKKEKSLHTCRICGCTEEKACMTDKGPCHWVSKDLCSVCAEKERQSKPDFPDTLAKKKGKKEHANLLDEAPKANRYIFNGHEIFVSAGLGGEEFGTFRVSDGGSGIKRIVAATMPMVKDRDAAQNNLDAFAIYKGLKEK